MNGGSGVFVQEFLLSTANDTRRESKTPLAPATKGLKGLMQKLGSVNARHEALVRRVDELEVIVHTAVFGCCGAAHEFSTKLARPWT